ncbi:hypothetical protein FH039_09695 [Thermococcus indicus]|uniref:Uncharacterized protein n=1 Tax=Thermococcus indicus TaxID=2586643 RepID=A0A4Y5SN99_9EURY|nr:hypothetical protein [Thermococcus indicus]QDA31814.1 hypothetical protein FH039_09695 [Thermococcus indicus]
MRDSLALFTALFLIVLFFLPAYYIGPLYFLLVAVYLLSLYAVERLCPGRSVVKIVEVTFFLTVMFIMAWKAGRPRWEVLALGAILLALEAAKNFASQRSSR